MLPDFGHKAKISILELGAGLSPQSGLLVLPSG